jgi:hypothetical protein
VQPIKQASSIQTNFMTIFKRVLLTNSDTKIKKATNKKMREDGLTLLTVKKNGDAR